MTNTHDVLPAPTATPDLNTPAATPSFTSAPRPDVNGPDVIDDRRRQTVVVVAVFVVAILGLVWIWMTLTTTSAAFSDQERFDQNRLGAGTLDVEVGERTISFAATNMAAGDRVTGQVEFKNAGSLPLLYELSAFAPASPLRKELDIVAWKSPGDCTPTPPLGRAVWQVLDNAAALAGVRSGSLAPGASQLICLSATLSFDASSAAQGQRLDLIIGIDALHDVAATIGGES